MILSKYYNGYIDSTQIYRTTDAASHWDLLNIPKVTYTSITFFSRDTGWILGEKGTILKTVDGGTSWGKQKCPVNYTLNQITRSPDHKTYWIVGDSSTVLYSRDDGGEVLMSDIVKLSLPFKSVQKSHNVDAVIGPTVKRLLIKTGYTTAELLTLEVFNCSGEKVFENRCVTTIGKSTDIMLPGQLKSGLYICTVRNAGKFVLSDKVLIP